MEPANTDLSETEQIAARMIDAPLDGGARLDDGAES